jgi:hypothetical protein
MAATLAPAHSGFSPPIPQSFEDLGISQSLVLDLVLRRLLLEGFSNLQSLSNTLKLSVPILNIVFTHMRQQQLVEVKGMLGNDYNFTLSQAGKMLAGERFQISQYAGAAPVSLKDYSNATKAQAAQVRIDRKILRSAFSDLVVNDQLLDQLGPALISQNSIFVYGPTGNGKTSLAERMLRVYQDAVLMPYAVEVDNQVISLYDPVPAALHRGGRRVDPQHAGIAPGRSLGYLRRAAANEGQQRHLHHRRFWPPVDVAARPAESLDCAFRPSRGLSDVALRREIPDSLRAHGGVLH